jgi:aldehyde dehydrogenase (NAD+)
MHPRYSLSEFWANLQCFYASSVPRDDLSAIERIIIEQTKDYIIGSPNDPETTIGPLASKKQFDRVKKYIEIGISEGAEILLGQVPIDYTYGYYVNPVVFTNVTNDMRIAQEEIFGPVLVVIPYDTTEEAVKIANDSIYGLAGAVYGKGEEGINVARQIKTGSIFVDRGEWDVHAPFGGYKQSGLGREGGVPGYEEFLEIKSMYIAG